MACTTEIFMPVKRYANGLTQAEDFLSHSIGSRAVSAVGIPLSAATLILDVSLGIIAATGSLLTLGLCTPLFNFAQRQLSLGTYSLLRMPYLNLIHTLNPDASYSPGVELLSQRVFDQGYKIAKEFRKQENILERHILSRVMFVATLVGVIFTRIIELVIAVVAAPLALICLGKISLLNAVAYQALTFPCIIHEVFVLTSKAINPWAGS